MGTLIFLIASLIPLIQKQWKERWMVQAMDQGAVEGAMDVLFIFIKTTPNIIVKTIAAMIIELMMTLAL